MDCEHKSYVLLYQMHWSYSVVVGDNHNDSLQPATSSTIAKKHAEPQRVTSNTQQATGILPKHMQNHNESPATHNKPPVTKKAGTR
jgi:hypothetical protein